MSKGSIPDTEKETDLGLVAPLCYITTPINRILGKLLFLLINYWFVTLPVLGVLYVAALGWVMDPEVGASRYVRGLVIMAPLLVFGGGLVTYMWVTTLLLAVSAREPAVRVGVAGFLLVTLYGTFLGIALVDSWLFHKVGAWGVAAVVVAYLVTMPQLLFHYREFLMRHYRWTTPVLLLLGALSWFETESGFSTTTISLQDVSSMDCYSKTVHGTRTNTFSVCDVSVVIDGHELVLEEVFLPDSRVRYLEIRHALFDHYSLR